MKSGVVSYVCPVMESVFTYDGMLSVMLIINWLKGLWVAVRSGQYTNRVSKVIRNCIWKRIRGIPVFWGERGLSSMRMEGRFK